MLLPHPGNPDEYSPGLPGGGGGGAKTIRTTRPSMPATTASTITKVTHSSEEGGRCVSPDDIRGGGGSPVGSRRPCRRKKRDGMEMGLSGGGGNSSSSSSALGGRRGCTGGGGMEICSCSCPKGKLVLDLASCHTYCGHGQSERIIIIFLS